MEDLQSLLEKINREGVEKAEAEAARIVDEAKAKAAAIVKEAEETAARATAAARQEQEASAARAAETIRQGARDTLLKVEASVTALLEKLLVADVEKALGDEATVVALVTEAVKGLAGPAEVAVPARLAPALKAQLAAQLAAGELTVVMDDALGTGFSVSQDGGRIEHAFTGAAVAAELARRLRPDLAALLK